MVKNDEWYSPVVTTDSGQADTTSGDTIYVMEPPESDILGRVLCALASLDITLTTPNGKGYVRGTVPVKWTTSGTSLSPEVTIWGYRLGSGWTELASRLPNSPQTWNWNTLASADGIILLYIFAVDTVLGCYDGDISDFSFVLDNTKPSVAITSPVAGDVWTGTRNVTWNTTDANPYWVRIDVSSNGGSTWSTLVANRTDVGYYLWDTSGYTEGPNYRLRINATDKAGNTNETAMSGDFALDHRAPITAITAPANGAFWRGTQSITWSTNDNNSNNVTIQSSANGGTSWSDLVVGTTDDGSHSWDTTTVSDGAQYRIRITPTDKAGNVGSTNATENFTIDNTLPALTITAPVNGTVWKGTQTITWSNTETNKDVVKIEYSADGGSTWTVLNSSTPDDGSHPWDTDAVAEGQNYRLRINATDDAGNVNSTTSGTFAIDRTAPSSTVTAPVAGNVWRGTKTITWSTTDLNRDVVQIEYSANGGTSWSNIAASTADDGSYDWDTTAVADGAQYRIRVTPTDKAGSAGSASSVNNFTIDNTAPSLSITSPSGGIVSGVLNITWSETETNKDVVKVEYSSDGGSTWTTIVASTADVGYYNWNTTSVADGSYKVRVTATDDAGNTGNATSASFTINNNAPSPSGLSTAAAVGASATITWVMADNDLTDVTLQVSCNGAAYSNIATGVSNTGSYAWNSASTSEGSCTLRLVATDVGSNTGTATSTSFTADHTTPLSSVTSPTLFGDYRGNVDIQWISQESNKGTVKIEYSLDGGATWITISASTSDDSQFTWDSVASGVTKANAMGISVTPTDAAGNVGVRAGSQPFHLDNTFPSVPGSTSIPLSISGVTSGRASGAWGPASGSVCWTAATDSTFSGYSFAMDALPDDSVDSGSACASFAGLQDGVHRFSVKALNAAGWGPVSSADLQVDTTPPTVGIAAPASTSETSYTLTVSASDASSGVASVAVEYRWNDGAWRALASAAGSVAFSAAEGPGTYEFRASASDGAGNVAGFPGAAQASAVVEAPPPPAARLSTPITAPPASDGESAPAEGNVAPEPAPPSPPAALPPVLKVYRPSPGAPVIAEPSKEVVTIVRNAAGTDGSEGAPGFYLTDANADGTPETFVDPAQKLSAIEILPAEDGASRVVIGKNNQPVAVWVPETGSAEVIAAVTEPLTVEAAETAEGRLALTVTVQKRSSGVVVVPDPAPGRPIARVVRTIDNSDMPLADVRRADGNIILADDVSDGYLIIYGAAQATPASSLNAWVMLIVLALFAFGGAETWRGFAQVRRARAAADAAAVPDPWATPPSRAERSLYGRLHGAVFGSPAPPAGSVLAPQEAELARILEGPRLEDDLADRALDEFVSDITGGKHTPRDAGHLPRRGPHGPSK